MNLIPMRWGKGATRTVVQIKNADRKPKRFRGGGEVKLDATWWRGIAGWSATRSQKHRRRAARRVGR